MAKYQGTPEFSHDQPPSTGVLLVNLGTPEAPTPDAVRRFLAEFLWDPRVVEMARPLWWLILHGVILRLRPSRVAKAYQTVWTEDGSPLLAISKRQVQAVGQALARQTDGRVEVVLGMRYGKPSIEAAMRELRSKGMRRLLVLPLYPQYSATTTASIFDEVFRVLKGWRWVPELRLIQHYHDHPPYIDALAASVREHWDKQGRAGSPAAVISRYSAPQPGCRRSVFLRVPEHRTPVGRAAGAAGRRVAIDVSVPLRTPGMVAALYRSHPESLG